MFRTTAGYPIRICRGALLFSMRQTARMAQSQIAPTEVSAEAGSGRQFGSEGVYGLWSPAGERWCSRALSACADVETRPRRRTCNASIWAAGAKLPLCGSASRPSALTAHFEAIAVNWEARFGQRRNPRLDSSRPELPPADSRRRLSPHKDLVNRL